MSDHRTTRATVLSSRDPREWAGAASVAAPRSSGNASAAEGGAPDESHSSGNATPVEGGASGECQLRERHGGRGRSVGRAPQLRERDRRRS